MRRKYEKFAKIVTLDKEERLKPEVEVGDTVLFYDGASLREALFYNSFVKDTLTEIYPERDIYCGKYVDSFSTVWEDCFPLTEEVGKFYEDYFEEYMKIVDMSNTLSKKFLPQLNTLHLKHTKEAQ